MTNEINVRSKEIQSRRKVPMPQCLTQNRGNTLTETAHTSQAPW